MPKLHTNDSGAKVINVSSSAYMFASELFVKGFKLEDWNSEKGYLPWVSYGRSKLPGIVRTDLARYLIGDDFVSIQDKEAPKFKPTP